MHALRPCGEPFPGPRCGPLAALPAVQANDPYAHPPPALALQTNKMAANNLAIVFGPTLMRAKNEHADMMVNMNFQQVRARMQCLAALAAREP